MNTYTQSLPTSFGPWRALGARGRMWARELALFGAIAGLLVLDIGALGCDAGLASVDQLALHLWGPQR